ncbi:hypothetical protein Dimus_032061 [Dionaea muscipula]
MSFLDESDRLHKPFLVCCDDHNVEEINDDTSPMDQDDQVKVKKPRLSTSLDPVDNIQIDSSTGEAAATPMAKRMSRKSKSKIKVVHQVAAIGSVPDKWTQRKYGWLVARIRCAVVFAAICRVLVWVMVGRRFRSIVPADTCWDGCGSFKKIDLMLFVGSSHGVERS